MRNARHARDRAPAIDHGTVAPSGPRTVREGGSRPERSRRERHNRLTGRTPGCAATVRSCTSSSSRPWSAHSSVSRWQPFAEKHRRRRGVGNGRPAMRVAVAAHSAEVIAAEAVAVRTASAGKAVAVAVVVAAVVAAVEVAAVAAGAVVAVAGVAVVEVAAVVVAAVAVAAAAARSNGHLGRHARAAPGDRRTRSVRAGLRLRGRSNPWRPAAIVTAERGALNLR
jgi:hypothetical protein